MKTMAYKFLGVVLAVTLASATDAKAAQIEGVRFQASYEAGSVQLPLQGTALFRYMGLFKAYVGAIYYEQGLSPEALLGDTPKRLEVSYFYAIKGEDFGFVTDKIIARNTNPQTLEKIRPQIAYHNSLYRDVKPGDRYALTYLPGSGTELSLNGERLGVIPGAEFASALFAMWLGDTPMSQAFKEQLLGSR